MAVRHTISHHGRISLTFGTSRAARWWAGSPGRIATVVPWDVQWGGLGPAMSMPDGSPAAPSCGVRRCARRAYHHAAPVGPAPWCRIASDARPRRPRGHRRGHSVLLSRPATSPWGLTIHSLLLLAGPHPLKLGAGPAVGPGTGRAGIGHSSTPRADAPLLTRPLARSPRPAVPASQVLAKTRRRLGRRGPLGPGRARPRWDPAGPHRPGDHGPRDSSRCRLCTS